MNGSDAPEDEQGKGSKAAERVPSSGEGADTALRAMLRKRRQDVHADPDGRTQQQQPQPPEKP